MAPCLAEGNKVITAADDGDDCQAAAPVGPVDIGVSRETHTCCLLDVFCSLQPQITFGYLLLHAGSFSCLLASFLCANSLLMPTVDVCPSRVPADDYAASHRCSCYSNDESTLHGPERSLLLPACCHCCVVPALPYRGCIAEAFLPVWPWKAAMPSTRSPRFGCSESEV